MSAGTAATCCWRGAFSFFFKKLTLLHVVSFFSLKFKIEMDIVFSLKVRLIDVLHSGESYNGAML